MHRSRRMTALIAVVAGWAAAAGRPEWRRAERPDDRPQPTLRPPAVPLVASDPYFSIWSMADRLTDDTTRHWTRREHPLVSLIRIDGKAYRLMGDEPKDVPALPQVGLQVLPTRTIYDFDDGQVHVTLTFMTPALPDDLDVLARPLTYLTWDVRSVDGERARRLDLRQRQRAAGGQHARPGGRLGARDDRRPDGAAGRDGRPDAPPAGRRRHPDRLGLRLRRRARRRRPRRRSAPSRDAARRASSTTATLPDDDDARMPRAANDDEPVLAFVFDLGQVGAEPVSRHLMIAYDEIYAIKFLGQKLRPYWRRDGATPADLLQAAERDYAEPGPALRGVRRAS